MARNECMVFQPEGDEGSIAHICEAMEGPHVCYRADETGEGSGHIHIYSHIKLH